MPWKPADAHSPADPPVAVVMHVVPAVPFAIMHVVPAGNGGHDHRRSRGGAPGVAVLVEVDDDVQVAGAGPARGRAECEDGS